MKSTTYGWLLITALAGPLAAQEPEAAPPEKAGREQAAPEEQAPQTPRAQVSEAETRKLVDQLGDPAFQVRRAAEQELRERGKDALKELQKAAEEHADSEVRWRAGRLVRQIEGSDDDGGLRARQRGERRDGGQDLFGPRIRWAQPGLPPDMDEVFGELFERLERQFELDIPRRSFFHDDFFQDLEAQMEELRSRAQGSGPQGFGGHGESMQMRVGPDGVKIEVEERDANGEVQKKTYEAPDLETFREKYPDVAQRFLGRGGAFRMPGIQTWRFDAPLGGTVRRLPQLTPMTPMTPAPSGPRLGIYVREGISDDLRGFLGIDEGTGLMVESVEQGSLAERLGIEAGDVVLEVAGKRVGTAADVSSALREAEDTVEVRVNRRGTERTLKAEKEAGGGGQALKPRKEKRAEVR